MSEILTPRSDFLKLYSSNQTTAGTSITAPTLNTTGPSVTEASPGGFFPMSRHGGCGMYSNAAIIFFGTDAANETAIARVNGWRRVGYSSDAIWVPVPLLALTITLGTQTGASTKIIGLSDLLADTITASTAFTSAYEIISPADNTCAMVKVDGCGCDFIQVQLAVNASSASINCAAAGF